MKFTRIFLIFLLSSLFVFADNIEYDHELSVKGATFRRLKEHKKTNTLQSFWERPSETDLPEKYISPSGRFVIHYTKTGTHGVDLTDRNNNNIPDYIDSVAYYFDFAYQKEVVEMGYNQPLEDTTFEGSEYEIYIADCGNGDTAQTYYGVTIQSTIYEIIDGVDERCATFIILDNNYSPDDKTKKDENTYFKTYGTTGIDALKITAVHEFHHAIQISYSRQALQSAAVNEMTSTFMEYRFFPEVKDYQRYINKLLKNLSGYPFGDGYYDNGYGWSAFMILIHSKYGDRVIKNLWDNIGAGMPSYQALNEALRTESSNIITELKDVVNWLYYTGSRAVEGKYFSDAKDMKEMTFFQTSDFSSPAYMVNNTLIAYQLRPFRVIFKSNELNLASDTLDFIIIDNDLQNAVEQFLIPKEYSITISDDISSCDLSVLGAKYCFNNADKTGQIIPVLFEHFGANIVNGDFVFPQPYNPSNDNFIAFPVDYKIPLGKKATLSVFDLNNSMLYSSIIQVTAQPILMGENNSKKVIKWSEIQSNISSGVYIYRLEFEDAAYDSKFGKFTVKKINPMNIEFNINGITKKYGSQLLFKDLSFTISNSTALTISGANGAGKSTLLKILCGLIRPDKGSIELNIDNKRIDINDFYKYIGFVSPYLNLYDELTMNEHINFISKLRKEGAENSLIEILSNGLMLNNNKLVKQYSSGMKQKLKYILAIVFKPEILILDEPFTNLDKMSMNFLDEFFADFIKSNALIIASNDFKEQKLSNKEILIA